MQVVPPQSRPSFGDKRSNREREPRKDLDRYQENFFEDLNREISILTPYLCNLTTGRTEMYEAAAHPVTSLPSRERPTGAALAVGDKGTLLESHAG